MIVSYKKFCFDHEPDLLFIYIWPGPYLCLMQIAVIDPLTEVTAAGYVKNLRMLFSFFLLRLDIHKQKLCPIPVFPHRQKSPDIAQPEIVTVNLQNDLFQKMV